MQESDKISRTREFYNLSLHLKWQLCNCCAHFSLWRSLSSSFYVLPGIAGWSFRAPCDNAKALFGARRQWHHMLKHVARLAKKLERPPSKQTFLEAVMMSACVSRASRRRGRVHVQPTSTSTRAGVSRGSSRFPRGRPPESSASKKRSGATQYAIVLRKMIHLQGDSVCCICLPCVCAQVGNALFVRRLIYGKGQKGHT